MKSYIASSPLIGPGRGECSVCGKVRGITSATGMVQRHKDCLGSGKPPLKRKASVVVPYLHGRRSS